MENKMELSNIKRWRGETRYAYIDRKKDKPLLAINNRKDRRKKRFRGYEKKALIQRI